MVYSAFLEKLIYSLPTITKFHSYDTQLYQLLKIATSDEIEKTFSNKKDKEIEFKPFGNIIFPYHSMGVIDTLDLFGIDEIIIFSYYWINKKRYSNVLDIGANLGLHSIIMDKCGFKVKSFEPDPTHFKILKNNLKINSLKNVEALKVAVSDTTDKKEFVRVLGNTTSSHLAGSKLNPYGDLETFPVNTISINDIIKGVDLIKLDVEGHEKEILLTIEKNVWENLDALVEIQDIHNATIIYKHFNKLKINMFSQKRNWSKVTKFSDMPINYKEGTLFISQKSKMSWMDNLIK